MNLTSVSATQLAAFVALGAILLVGVVAFLTNKMRRPERPRTNFDGAEHARAADQDGSRRNGKARLEARSQRVETFHLRPLTAGDHARFIESWHTIQARFVEGPAGAVADADRLVADIMSKRGYPACDFERSAAGISLHYPRVLGNFRTAHAIAIRQKHGEASTEELRRGMLQFRTLLDALVNAPELPVARAASLARQVQRTRGPGIEHALEKMEASV